MSQVLHQTKLRAHFSYCEMLSKSKVFFIFKNVGLVGKWVDGKLSGGLNEKFKY